MIRVVIFQSHSSFNRIPLKLPFRCRGCNLRNPIKKNFNGNVNINGKTATFRQMRAYRQIYALLDRRSQPLPDDVIAAFEGR